MRNKSIPTWPSASFLVSTFSAACVGVLWAAFAASPARADGISKACVTPQEYGLVKSTFKRKQLVLREFRVQGVIQDSIPSGFIAVLGVGAISLRNLDTLRLESEDADSLETRVRAFIARSVRHENSIIEFKAAP